jgi:hypothetical protein
MVRTDRAVLLCEIVQRVQQACVDVGVPRRAGRLRYAGNRANGGDSFASQAAEAEALPVEIEVLRDGAQKVLCEVAIIAANALFSSPLGARLKPKFLSPR